MLFGIVAKNSILLVDFAVEMMNHGMEKDQAICEAGHKRAQPIVMTTVAMVAGMLPIALSLTGDGSWRAPMGVTVIGGLHVLDHADPAAGAGIFLHRDLDRNADRPPVPPASIGSDAHPDGPPRPGGVTRRLVNPRPVGY